MKMTLDEAIAHAKELSENQSMCEDCREEHKQLAEWLEQLRDYKNIFEEKQETNYEHFKDEVIENCGFTFALVDGKPCQCSGVSCCNCGFSTGHGCREKIEEWLKSPYKKPTYKLSQFEFDLIQTYRDGNNDCKLSARRILRELKDKGYFKCADYDTKVSDILANCEVIK
ncbi:hypothetical protein [Holdemanella biformis]|jgi:hypothetical protein